MAKVFLPPEEIKLPVYEIGEYEKNDKEMEAYIEKVVQWCKDNSKCKDAGEIISFPVGDGCARYVVFKYTELLWLEEGDCYSIPEAHSRGLRKADIVEKINQQKAWDEMVKEHNKKLKASL